MSLSIEQRHWRIVNILFAGLLTVGGFYSGSVGVKAAIQSDKHDAQTAAYEHAVESNEFWQVVVGDMPAVGTRPSDLLASDLHRAIGATDDPNAQLPAEVVEFNGAPQAYRGITEDLGFNPFTNDGSGCVECGTLSDEMRDKLLDAKRGNVDAILTTPVPPDPKDKINWIGFLPFWLEAILVWQITGWISMMIAMHRFGDPRMTWRRRDGVADRQEALCFVGAPSYMLFFHLTVNRRRLRALEQLRMEKLQATSLHAPYEELTRAIDDLKAMGRNRSTTDNRNLQVLITQRERIIDIINQSIADSQQRPTLPVSSDADHIAELLRQVEEGLEVYRFGREASGLS